jgi:hypothetical protein
MTITYIEHETNLGNVMVPKLHRVVYAHTTDGVQAQWQISYKDYIVNQWLEENCKHPYYHSPGYLTEKFIEFECDRDAVWFALRWS